MKTVRLTGMMICLALWLCFPSAGDAAKHALVIGNGDYEGVPLSTPVNDADAMSSVLKSLGFSVEKKTDLNHSEMEDTIRAFGTRLSGGDTALFQPVRNAFASPANMNGLTGYLNPLILRIPVQTIFTSDSHTV